MAVYAIRRQEVLRNCGRCAAPGLSAAQQALTLTDSLMVPISIRPGTLAGSGISASLLCGLPGSTGAALVFLPLLPGAFSFF